VADPANVAAGSHTEVDSGEVNTVLQSRTLSALDVELELALNAPDDASVAAGSQTDVVVASSDPLADTMNTLSDTDVAVADIAESLSRTRVESEDVEPEAVASCGLVRIRVPLASLVTVFNEVPYTKAEPSGTLRADALFDAVAEQVADAVLTLTSLPSVDTPDVAAVPNSRSATP
jgi:hypothetical protein